MNPHDFGIFSQRSNRRPARTSLTTTMICATAVVWWSLGLLGCESMPIIEPITDEKCLLLKREPLDDWFDQHQYTPGGGIFIQGPTVLRSRGNAAFIWQTNSIQDWGIQSTTPSLIVVKDTDSMRLLTAFNTSPAPWETRIVTSGRFQGEKILGNYCYQIELTDEADLGSRIKEAFSFEGGAKDELFDLSNGRVFIVQNNIKMDGNIVVQKNYNLPPESTFDSINKMGADAKESYELFDQWLESCLENRKSDSAR